VHRAVVEDLVVDLVGQDQEVVPAGQVEQAEQGFPEYTAPVGLFG